MASEREPSGLGGRLLAKAKSVARDPVVRRRAKQVAVPAAILWTMAKTRSLDDWPARRSRNG